MDESDSHSEATPDRTTDVSNSDDPETETDTMLSTVSRRDVLSSATVLALLGFGTASQPARGGTDRV